MGGKVGGGGTVIKILTEKNISQGHDVLSCKHDELAWDRINIKTRIRYKQIKGSESVISMQRWQSYNGTFKYFVWSSMNQLSMF